MKVIKYCIPGLAMLLISTQALALATLLGDPANGGELESERCSGCHVRMSGGDGNGIYTRPERIQTIEGLMKRVELCNVNTQNGELGSDQIDDIVAYLNETFYLFED